MTEEQVSAALSHKTESTAKHLEQMKAEFLECMKRANQLKNDIDHLEAIEAVKGYNKLIGKC